MLPVGSTTCQDLPLVVPVPVPATQHAGLASRRYYDLSYIAIMFLVFPLYWSKAVNWRLCSPSYPGESDPWLIQAPSHAWVEGWPCSGNQLKKLTYMLSSPEPFVRSLLWPFSYSELHFFTSFYTVFVGGLVMLFITRGSDYDVANPWRLSWAFLARAQVRVGPILVKLLRPQTPWPLIISQSLLVDAPANVPFSLALMGPWRHLALGALIDVASVIIISRLYGTSWPYATPPKAVVLLNAACGLFTVCVSALIGSRRAASRPPGGLVTQEISQPVSPKEGLEDIRGLLATSEDETVEEEVDEEVDEKVEVEEGQGHPACKPARRAGTAASVAALAYDPACAGTSQLDDLNEPSIHAPPAAVELGSSEGQLLLCRCSHMVCREAVSGRGSGGGGVAAAEYPGQPRSFSSFMDAGSSFSVCGDDSVNCPYSSHSSSSNGSKSTSTSASVTGTLYDARGVFGAADVAIRRNGIWSRAGDVDVDGDVGCEEPSGHGDRDGCLGLTWAHLYLKVPGLEPGDLPPGVDGRLAAAVAEGCPGVAASTDIAIRSGCVEVHLDLVRQAAPVVTGPSAASVGPAAAAVAAAAPGQGGATSSQAGPSHVVDSGTGMMMTSSSHLGPASTEQQGLATCILQALGLPPGYDAAVRAQVGAHLLTLTPAAGSGAGWAVLGTRRIQAHEVPRVTKVDPPVVVAAPAAAGHVTVTLQVTISGSLERLTMAHEDADLEVLALFEGAFLKLSELRWGPLEESPYAAVASSGGGGSDAATAVAGPRRIVRLPPSLALSRRTLTLCIELPAGRTGAVSLLLMRRGTAGQNYPLLFLQPGDAAIAAEISALQERAGGGGAAATAADADGPPLSSIASFTRDLGHWLQYRDFWRRKAAAAALLAVSARGAGGGAAANPSRYQAGRLSVAWMRAWLSWSRWNDAGGGEGDSCASSSAWSKLKPRGRACVVGQLVAAAAPHPGHLAAPATSASGHAAATLNLHAYPAQAQGDSDLLDQGYASGTGIGNGNGYFSSSRGGAGGGGGGGSGVNQPAAAAALRAQHNYPPFNRPTSSLAQQPLRCVNGTGLPSPSAEEQQRLVQSSLPAFGQRAYQGHMQTARRVLLEFALEQRCAAVAAALLEPAPVPLLPPAAGTVAAPTATIAAAPATYGSATYIAELAESSRAASPDGLTLLHRAVRSGDAATVEVILLANTRVVEAAAAAAAAAPPPARLLRPVHHFVQKQAVDYQRWPITLYDWSTTDVHGITPLHYLAVLDDGGALARHVLATHAEAHALWNVARPDMPSPASFAAQNGVFIDTEVLHRAKLRQEDGVGNGDVSGQGIQPTQQQHVGTRPLFLAAVLGFPCGDLEQRYQRYARAQAQSGAPSAWLLLPLHVAANVAVLLQAFTQPHACCRRAMLPLVVLQGLGFLLALYCHRPVVPPRGSMCRVAAWAMQAVALGMLLARTISLESVSWPVSCSEAATAATTLISYVGEDVGSCDGVIGFSAATAAGGACGSTAFYHSLLALYHTLAVVSVPYVMPYALHKVLAVQAVEVVTCVLLVMSCWALGCTGSFGAAAVADGGGDGSISEALQDAVGLSGYGSVNGSSICGAAAGGVVLDGSNAGNLGSAWAGGAAAHVAGGTLLRGVVSSLLILAADLHTRAAFVCSYIDSATPPLLQQQRQQQERQQQQLPHAKMD